MSIPEIYLIEPYNAYAPKQKKKHWMQEVEEQELLARIIAEQQALQEAAQAAKRTSNTLPPQAPETATPTIVGYSAGAGASGGRGSGAGGGGVPVVDFFNPGSDVVNFNRSPVSGDGPLTVTFTNFTTTPQFDSYNWYFTLDGVTVTSTDVNPVIVFQTGSTNPSTITASLQVTNSVTGVPGGRSPDVYTLVSVPVVVASFTYVTSSGPGPVTASFTNTSTNSSQTPVALTYLWTFGDTTTTSSTSPVHPYDKNALGTAASGTGSFTASLQATGSYGIASRYTQSFYIPAPTLTAAFTLTSASLGSGINSAPITESFTSTTAYNGSGVLSYLWTIVTGSTAIASSSVASSTASSSFVYRSGTSLTGSKYTASLQVTESNYNLMSSTTQNFIIITP